MIRFVTPKANMRAERFTPIQLKASMIGSVALSLASSTISVHTTPNFTSTRSAFDGLNGWSPDTLSVQTEKGTRPFGHCGPGLLPLINCQPSSSRQSDVSFAGPRKAAFTSNLALLSLVDKGDDDALLVVDRMPVDDV